MNKLSTWDLIRTSFRLTLVQSAWTHSSMQSEGLVYSLAPALSKIYGDQKNIRKILKHYKIPINTHPFLVPVLAGVLLKMETDKSSTRSIICYITPTMGALAAMGDPFFHSALAFASITAALIAMLFGPLAGIITLLIMFNTVHVAIRVSGIFMGYKKGTDAYETLGHWMDSSKTSGLKTASSITAGILIGLLLFRYAHIDHLLPTIAIAGMLCIITGVLLTMKRSAWIYILPVFLLLIFILEVTV